MKKMILAFTLLFGISANAAQMSVSGALGFFSVGNSFVNDNNAQTAMAGLSGLVALGADFEYAPDKDYSYGAYLRYHGTGDDYGTTDLSFSNLALGAMAKGYLNSRNWNFYYGAGLGIVSVSYEAGAAEFTPGMTFGPMVVLGGLYPLNDRLSMGIENMRLYALGEDTNGELVSDWTIKAKYDF